MSDRTEMTLLGTDDPLVWAQEFCRIFGGKMIGADSMNPSQHGPVDTGTMASWFASAMQTAVNLYERRALSAKEDDEEDDEDDDATLEESFLEGFQEGRPPT